MDDGEGCQYFVVCVPGSVQQWVFGPHQFSDMHGDVADLVTEQTAQAHEGSRISHDLLRIRHDFTPAGRRRTREQTQTSPSSPRRTPRTQESEAGTCRHPGGKKTATIRIIGFLHILYTKHHFCLVFSLSSLFLFSSFFLSRLFALVCPFFLHFLYFKHLFLSFSFCAVYHLLAFAVKTFSLSFHPHSAVF